MLCVQEGKRVGVSGVAGCRDRGGARGRMGVRACRCLISTRVVFVCCVTDGKRVSGAVGAGCWDRGGTRGRMGVHACMPMRARLCGDARVPTLPQRECTTGRVVKVCVCVCVCVCVRARGCVCVCVCRCQVPLFAHAQTGVAAQGGEGERS